MPAQTPQLPDLPPGPSLDHVRGPIEIPPFEPWQLGVMIALGLIALGLLIWGIVRFVRARKNRAEQLQPHTTAFAELKTAAKCTAGDDERFAVLSSLALRRYFETGKGIPTLGRTTLEFLKALDGHALLYTEARASLATFLEHCDRVKFAQAALTEDERNALTESAITLIRQSEQSADAPIPEVAQP
ncbi:MULTISPECIES: hypothetical protein [unclassified Lentimonas]|uniref:hypothetical protein n=1 Tax=unclassified Lentimonas TaxID=2630993 RepID=UPI001327B3FB|nr:MULTISPECIES: hypothetical protein [unclassified Lentimonas]CAA6691403.1 Unannotated [Lentimonas sp. CC10]CAA6693143.1 Unannotated [Lentimonas sp. CC19]CAA7068975.1 Unannotated [Lentimonas sp. CC11]